MSSHMLVHVSGMHCSVRGCVCVHFTIVYSTIVRYLCSKPRAVGSKCKSRGDVVCFSRYSTVRLEMFFCCVCFYVLFVLDVL